MEQMLANGIQLIKTNASYVFDSDTVFYRNEIPFANQSNEFDITDCFYAQPIDFTDISVLQFLTVNASVTCVVKNYLGVTLATINGVNVGTYDTQNVFNIEINWSAIVGNLEQCYLQITDGTEYFKTEPLKMINLKQRIKIRYRMLRNHKSVGYFFNPQDEFYEFFHIFYIEAAITEFKREIVKSVFEDSNQTLINLFGTFRHSFLLKTFQVAYYMHEKVVTLSLCDEIYLSEIKAGNEYEGRVFLSKDETPQEEIIESTNLYVSSTRYVVDRAFRLVGAAQETPIIPDFDFGIVPIHHTNPNGKKATFKTPYKLLPSKTLYTPQGNPTDYLFKIGGATDNFRNSHDIAWDSIASKTFAEFSALTVNENLHVQVRYIGSLTQTDIVATLYAPIADTPINPSTRTINPNPKTAASDLLIYPKLITGFNSVGISAGAANLFSQQRTFSELANSSDLTNFNAGIANLPITTETGIGHLYLQRTNTTPLTVNITTNQSDPKKEIITYATPLSNFAYPVSGNGVNPPALRNDKINDIYEIINTRIRNTIAFNLMPINFQYSAFFTFHYNSTGGFNYILSQEAGSSLNNFIIYANRPGYELQGINLNNNDIECRADDLILVPNQVYTLVCNYTKLANTGTYGNIFTVDYYLNGRKGLTVPVRNNPYLVNIDYSTANIRVFGGRAYGAALSQNAGRSFGLLYNRHATAEEIRRYALGDETVLSTCQDAWIFDTLVASPLDPNWREIPNIGTLGDATSRIIVKNTTNTVGTLFT